MPPKKGMKRKRVEEEEQLEEAAEVKTATKRARKGSKKAPAKKSDEPEQKQAAEEKVEKEEEKKAEQKPEEKKTKPKKAEEKKGDQKKNVVLTFGSGDMSQLGHGSEENMLQRKFPTVVKALLDKNVVQISAGALHNAVVTEDGEVYTWGCNDEHALGHEEDEWFPARAVGELRDKVVKRVACGASHTSTRLWP